MAVIHSQLEECVKNKLDLFTVSFTQTSIEKSTFIEIHLNNIYLFMRVRIVNTDGTHLTNDADVDFINYPGCTFFSQVPAINTYPHYGEIKCLINYRKFSTGLFCKDPPKHRWRQPRAGIQRAIHWKLSSCGINYTNTSLFVFSRKNYCLTALTYLPNI